MKACKKLLSLLLVAVLLVSAIPFQAKADGFTVTVIVEKGCFAILSAEAQKAFKIEGEGTVLTYVDGKSEMFTHYLGSNWN